MIVETASFRLATGVDEATFLAADGRVQEELMLTKPALVRRTTARAANGEWLVMTLWWQDHEDTEAAGPATDALLSMVDHATIRRRRYDTLD